MQWSWRIKNGDRYFYDENGHFVVNQTLVIEGEECEFDSSGRYVNPILRKIEELRGYTYVQYIRGGTNVLLINRRFGDNP